MSSPLPPERLHRCQNTARVRPLRQHKTPPSPYFVQVVLPSIVNAIALSSASCIPLVLLRVFPAQLPLPPPVGASVNRSGHRQACIRSLVRRCAPLSSPYRRANEANRHPTLPHVPFLHTPLHPSGEVSLRGPTAECHIYWIMYIHYIRIYLSFSLSVSLSLYTYAYLYKHMC